MEKGHLDTDDFLKYLDTEDVSDSYLDWMQEVQEHLDICESCRKLLHKAMLADRLSAEESMEEELQLLKQEEQLRRHLLGRKLYIIGKNRRMTDLAEKIQRGFVWNRPVDGRELLETGKKVPQIRERAAALYYRSYDMPGERPTEGEKGGSGEGRQLMETQVRWKDGVIRVEITGMGSKSMLVVLNPETGTDTMPFYGMTTYDPATGKAVVEFESEKPLERYRLYLDWQK